MYRNLPGRFAAPLLALTVAAEASGQQLPPPKPPVAPTEPIVLVQQERERPETERPAIQQQPPVAPTPAPTPTPTQTAPSQPTMGTNQNASPSAVAPTTQVNFNNTGPGGANAAAQAAAPDVGSQLSRSQQAVGVSAQQRNPVSTDTRIRGLRNGQYLTTANGAPFYPARLDLDTPVSKFDPGSVAAVNLTRGPYTTLLGPGFAFLDIIPQGTGRVEPGQEPVFKGKTALKYQSNGNQWSGLQTVELWGDWYGFRGGYNVLSGNDYEAGNGVNIPASYTANNFNFALGLQLTTTSKVEFRGLRNRQTNVEFPGLYFDIRQADTEAYGMTYDLTEAGPFDKVTLDTWYNGTSGTGDTRNQRKQNFVSSLLATSFREGGIGFPADPAVPPSSTVAAGNSLFRDTSTTRFAERSIGYRLTADFGKPTDDLWYARLGTDLNVFGQGLTENIEFRNIARSGNPDRPQYVFPTAPASLGTGTVPFQQTQKIPNSNSIDPGIFFESTYKPTKRLTLQTGARLDWVVTSTSSRLITGNADLFGLAGGTTGTDRFTLDPRQYSANRAYSSGQDTGDLNRTFVLPAGFLTATYLLDNYTSLTLQYGHAQRAPNLTELYASGPFVGVLQTGTSRLIGDPFLSPEKINQFDIGLSWKNQDGSIQAGAKAFYAFITDYITYDANKLGRGVSQLVFTNTDLATLAGGELSASADLYEMLTPYGTLSYVQGIDQTHADSRRSPGLSSSRRNNPATRSVAVETEALPQIPPLESRIGLRVHARPDVNKKNDIRWQLDFSARIVAGQFNVARSLGEIPTGGFTVYDVSGYYKVTDKLTVAAGVENLTDILYREHLDPVASTLLSFTDRSVSPYYRPGTNFFFNTTYTW